MKKLHIIVSVMILVGGFLIFQASKDMSSYATFKDASQTSSKVKIVGQLVREKPMTYNPQKDPNKFSFFMKDSDGFEREVILLKAKPQDFELSEQLVVTGKISGDDFVASDILMKCPSKYKDEELFLRKET